MKHTADRLYTSTEAAELAGVTYRQLDYWTRLGVVAPTLPATGPGSGRERRWSWTAIDLIARTAEAIRIGDQLLTPRRIAEHGLEGAVADALERLTRLKREVSNG